MTTIPQKIHFIGIGGYGMSALARIMLQQGVEVSGSDAAQQAITDRLREEGAEVYIGHQAEQITGAELVVYSTAVDESNVERAAAVAGGIPTIHRSELLARLLNIGGGIAVAGAHGKTTTSAMIAFVLEQADYHPTYIIGGEITAFSHNAKFGDGAFTVAEADESDGSFLKYYVDHAVVTNIEADHLEHYNGNFSELQSAYKQFAQQVQKDGTLVLNADDHLTIDLQDGAGDGVRVETFGISDQAVWQAVDLQYETSGLSSFSVRHHGLEIGKMKLSVPGLHNIYNALAACVICMQSCKMSFSVFADAIQKFSGTKRRFQRITNASGVLVIDDYAHHPTEIAATIKAAKSLGKRVVAVFQPQRYTRTHFLFDEFASSFGEADEVILTDIYSPAGEAVIEGVNSKALVAAIQANGHPHVTYAATIEDVVDHLIANSEDNDLVLTMGAGNIWRAAEQFAVHLELGQASDSHARQN